MNLENAIAAHSEWKIKLRGAIAHKDTMNAASLSQDNQCELGKWLHGEARGKYTALPSYKSCVEKHAEFHKEAGRVAQAINAKTYDQAEKMLDGGTSYSRASSAVVVAIQALRKEAALG